MPKRLSTTLGPDTGQIPRRAATMLRCQAATSTRLRIVSMGAVVLWSLLAAYALVRSLEPGPFVAAGLVALAVYFVGVGLTERR